MAARTLPDVGGDTPVDTIAPWTIKSFPTALKQMILEAAADERLTVGQWLEKRVEEWLSNGKPVRVDREASRKAVVASTNRVESAEAAHAAAEMVRLAMQISGMPAEQQEDPLVKTAKITVQRSLVELRPPGRRPRKAVLTALPAQASAP